MWCFSGRFEGFSLDPDDISRLSDLIPNWHNYHYFGSNTSIVDGGSDMYDGGNFVSRLGKMQQSYESLPLNKIFITLAVLRQHATSGKAHLCGLASVRHSFEEMSLRCEP